MLRQENRLRSGRAFGPAIRSGRRAGTRTLVLHLQAPASETELAGPQNAAPSAPPAGSQVGSQVGPQVGLVVSKAVGNAVVRNTVKRRLRHLARERLASLPGSAVLVVRALPAAGAASSDELGRDLDRALTRVLGRS